MSYNAITWAMGQPVDKSSAKFVLVAMADCVNAEGGDMVCWPSYRHLAARTSQDVKTVEAGIKRLRDGGYIEDTGERQGRTGSVVVYRLNTTRSGVSLPQPEPRLPAATAPISGAALVTENTSVSTASNPASGATAAERSNPVFPASTPVFPDERPQISGEATPKTGDGIRNGIRKVSRKEPGNGAAPNTIPGVPETVLADWLVVRKNKRAGPITETVVKGLVREANKAGLTLEQAVTFCCEAGWQGFNAGWYANRVGNSNAAPGSFRNQGTGETPFERNQRETVEAATGGLVSRRPRGNPREVFHEQPAPLAID